MKRSIYYATLVGKFVRMERPANEQELEVYAEQGRPQIKTVGCEGIVAYVRDADVPERGGACVEIVMDYGIGYPVMADDEDCWEFNITSAEHYAKHVQPEREESGSEPVQTVDLPAL